jgi:hypothetical protein
MGLGSRIQKKLSPDPGIKKHYVRNTGYEEPIRKLFFTRSGDKNLMPGRVLIRIRMDRSRRAKKKVPTNRKKVKNFHVLKCRMFSFEG